MPPDSVEKTLIDTALKMNQCGINQGSSGNLSIRQEGGFLITPSAMAYEDCEADDAVLMTLDGEFESKRRPSSEWRFHRDIYRARQDVQVVLHAHSPWCTTLACLSRPIPAFHYMVAVAGGKDIPCAGYATFGTQALSDAVTESLKERNACLMAHHGMICVGDSLEGVLKLAVEVENLAQVYAQALHIGDPAILSDEEMDRVLDAFVAYRAGKLQ